MSFSKKCFYNKKHSIAFDNLSFLIPIVSVWSWFFFILFVHQPRGFFISPFKILANCFFYLLAFDDEKRLRKFSFKLCHWMTSTHVQLWFEHKKKSVCETSMSRSGHLKKAEPFFFWGPAFVAVSDDAILASTEDR